MLARIPLLVVGVLAGCGTYRSLTSEVKHAEVECTSCAAGMAVAVGAPFKVKVGWKECDRRDQRCDPDQPPFTIAITCEGVPCEAVDTGSGDFEVTPGAAGTATIVVRLADKQQRELRLGPVTAVPLDGIELACTYLARGGTTAAPCGNAVPPGSDVHVEIVARGGERRLVNPLPRDVAVNGRVVLAEGSPTGDGTWQCRSSIESSDPSVPTVRRCVTHDVPAGASWTVEARLPAQKLAHRIAIKVAR